MMRFLLALVCLLPAVASAEERFPKPQFESGYVMPEVIESAPRSVAVDRLDVLLLFLALSLAAWLVLKRRSRIGIFALTVASMAYFGFWRNGCICSIGAIQNVALWGADPHYAMPWSAAAYFALPLVFALLFGRVFCAAVCPLGTIQDVVVLFPVRVPAYLSRVLELVPYLYLALAVLYAATGTAFIICRLDPFVPLFRLSGDLWMVGAGGVMLVLGIFVARPYCRFLCPYGVLLGWMSYLSKWHMTITPDACVTCRLCENSCPFDAILVANQGQPAEPPRAATRRLAVLIGLLPVIVVTSAWACGQLDVVLARLDARVELAEALREDAAHPGTARSLEVEAFLRSGKSIAEAQTQAGIQIQRFRAGARLVGAFLGAVIGLQLIGASARRTRAGYEPNKVTCLSCARCFKACPEEHDRLKRKRGLGIPISSSPR